jgi:hypothetical protein
MKHLSAEELTHGERLGAVCTLAAGSDLRQCRVQSENPIPSVGNGHTQSVAARASVLDWAATLISRARPQR